MSLWERFGVGDITRGRLGCLAIGVTGSGMVFLLVLLLLAPALYRGVQRLNSRHEQREGIGKKLPALQLRPLAGDGVPVALAELEGKVVLLNFWGTWCPPCRAELPEIARLYHDLATEPDFRLLAVSVGPGGPEDVQQLQTQTQRFLDQQGLDLPTYTDPDWVTRKAADHAFGLTTIPTTLLLDREGVIRAIWVGYSPGLVVAVRQRVARLLADRAEKPAPPAQSP